jgi:hypothetical protein
MTKALVSVEDPQKSAGAPSRNPAPRHSVKSWLSR